MSINLNKKNINTDKNKPHQATEINGNNVINSIAI